MNDSSNEISVNYCSSNSVLAVNANGRILEVFTPFRVVAKNTGDKRQVFIVDEVRSTAEDILVYVINGKGYFFYYFTLEIRF